MAANNTGLLADINVVRQPGYCDFPPFWNFDYIQSIKSEYTEVLRPSLIYVSLLILYLLNKMRKITYFSLHASFFKKNFIVFSLLKKFNLLFNYEFYLFKFYV